VDTEIKTGHTIILAFDPAVKLTDSGRIYCAACGRNVTSAVYPGRGSPAIGDWRPDKPATFARHKVTGRAVLARRGF
jgi:hypothetical protein